MVIFAGCATNKADLPDKQTIQSEKYLKGLAKETNKQLPKMLDDDTRLDKLTGKSKNLTYYYTLVKIKKGEYTEKEIKDAMTPTIKKSACTNGKLFTSNGVSLTSIYRSKGGKFMAKINILPKDCGY